MATLYKSVILCEPTAQINIDLSPYTVNWYADGTSKPAWVAEYQDSLNANTVAYGPNATGIAAGTYRIEFTLYEVNASGTNLGEYYIELIVPTECDHLETACCSSEAITLRWLNREGGISQWTFSGVRKYEVRVGSANTFKNPILQRQYSQRKDVYDGKSVSTKELSKSQADYLDTLRYSIQVWEWDGTTATAILLDNDSFLKYDSRTNIYEVSVKYIIAQEIIIQTQ